MSALRSASEQTNSLRARRAISLSESSGNFARRDLVGRLAGANWIGAWLASPGDCCPRRRAKSKPRRHCRVRSANQQPSMGGCAGQRAPLRAFDGVAKGIRRQRVADRSPGQGIADRPRGEAASRQTRAATRRYRRGAGPLAFGTASPLSAPLTFVNQGCRFTPSTLSSARSETANLCLGRSISAGLI